tara:strand:+ start:1446 stop:1628 length:183 start_codon:yes stop_codon:yes gene_type:complete
MITLILATALTFASSEPVTVEAHPACTASQSAEIISVLNLLCLPAEGAYRETVFRSGFDE